MQLAHLAYGKRDDQKDETGENDDDRDEDEQDGEDAGHPGGVEMDDRGLDQECNRRAKNEGAKEVAEEKEDDDGDNEGGDPEGDLEVAAAAPRIERQSGDRDPADGGGGRTLGLSFAGRSLVGIRTHVMQSTRSMTSVPGSRAGLGFGSLEGGFLVGGAVKGVCSRPPRRKCI